jgi:hypothetical protein
LKTGIQGENRCLHLFLEEEPVDDPQYGQHRSCEQAAEKDASPVDGSHHALLFSGLWLFRCQRFGEYPMRGRIL